jgi:hypothetical protein
MVDVPPTIHDHNATDASHLGDLVELQGTHHAPVVILHELRCDVEVRTTSSPGIHVTVRGPRTLAEHVQHYVDHALLTVEAPQLEEPQHTRRLDIRVDVPADIPICITDHGDGRYVLGNREADLTVELHGTASVAAGRLSRVYATLTDRTTLAAATLVGLLDARLTQRSALRIHAGEVDTLRLKTYGDSRATYDGTTKHACLAASGNSRIRLHRVTEQMVSRLETTFAAIRIGTAPADDA